MKESYRDSIFFAETSILSPSIELLMECLIRNPVKQTSIRQCLLKAMKPNSVILPLLFALGFEIYHAIGSKLLLIELSKLVYSISYDKLKLYKQSLMMGESTLFNSAYFCRLYPVSHNGFIIMWIIMYAPSMEEAPFMAWGLLLAQWRKNYARPKCKKACKGYEKLRCCKDS